MVIDQQEQQFGEKVNLYRNTYSQRIEEEQRALDAWRTRVETEIQSAKDVMRGGNDHLLLRKLEDFNHVITDLDDTTFTLGYDRVVFTPAKSVLTTHLRG